MVPTIAWTVTYTMETLRNWKPSVVTATTHKEATNVTTVHGTR